MLLLLIVGTSVVIDASVGGGVVVDGGNCGGYGYDYGYGYGCGDGGAVKRWEEQRTYVQIKQEHSHKIE